jgi:hypothetical protein
MAAFWGTAPENTSKTESQWGKTSENVLFLVPKWEMVFQMQLPYGAATAVGLLRGGS